MPRSSGDLYIFGSYRLDKISRVLSRSGAALTLAPKTFDLLVLLVESGGRLLSKRELMDALWQDTSVEEANLTFQISTLRKALGEEGTQWIETVPKHGYRFIGEVRSTPVAERPGIRASRKAKSVVGAGTLLTLAAGYLFIRPANDNHPNASKAFQQARMIRVTESGHAADGAISPDGKYVAYVERESLRLRKLGTQSDLEIAPTVYGHPANLVFSPDGERIYYTAHGDLYAIPALGGMVKKIMLKCDGRDFVLAARRPVCFFPYG